MIWQVEIIQSGVKVTQQTTWISTLSQEVLSLLFHRIWRVAITKFLTSCRFWVSPSTPSLQFDSWAPCGVHVQLSGGKKKQERWPSCIKRSWSLVYNTSIIWLGLEVRYKGFIHSSVLFKFGVEHCYIKDLHLFWCIILIFSCTPALKGS